MKVGVPTEIKTDEYRVALTPAGVRELADHGHEVVVQSGAGEGSAIPDSDYEAQGARILPDADAVFAEADMIVKVKEPQPEEVARLEPRHTLFTYLHLAPDPELTRGLMDVGRDLHRLRDRRGRPRAPAAAGADERGRGQDRHPGGRVHAREAARRPRHPARRRARAWPPAKVMVIGGGVVGMNAAFIAIGMEAEVYVYDRNIDRLRELDALLRRARLDLLRVDAGDRGAPARGRPRDRRRARPRRQGAARDHARAAQADEAGRGAGRRLDRPGRLLRDLAADDPLRPHLRGRRDHALLRGEHARRGADHLDLRADERDDALRPAPRRRRRRAAPRATTRGWPGGVNVVGGKVTYAPVADATGQPYTPLDEALGSPAPTPDPATAPLLPSRAVCRRPPSSCARAARPRRRSSPRRA